MAYDFPNAPTVGQVYMPAGGPSWQWDGIAWKSVSMQGEITIAKTFIPGGSSVVNYTYNKPANLRQLEFEGCAAGGTGSGATNPGASTWGFGAAGGAGAWGKKLFNAAALPSSVAITIGAPPVGVSGGPAASDTPDTTFGALITLQGGRRGAQGANVLQTSPPQFAAGGSATAAPTGVDIGAPGQPGDYAMAGMIGASSTTYVTIGASGKSNYGAGSYQIITTGFGPLDGTGYGAGGSGACNFGSVAARAGGRGAPGFVLLTEYLAAGSGAPYVTADSENRIINGDFRISQEWGTVITTGNGIYAADQWGNAFVHDGTLQVAQLIAAAGAGYPPNNTHLYINCSVADTAIAAGQYAVIQQALEGLRMADLEWGTAYSRGSLVLRFTAYGGAGAPIVIGVGLRNVASDMCFVQAVNILAGWNDYVIPIPEPATGTTWPTDNTRWGMVSFCVACGTTYQSPTPGQWAAGTYWGVTGQGNFLGAVNNNMRIANVGLYFDPGRTGVPPPWKNPDYATELMKCMRYWEKSYDYGVVWGSVSANGRLYIQRASTAAADGFGVRFVVPKRIAPTTVSLYSDVTGAAGNIRNQSAGVDVAASASGIGASGFSVGWTAAVNAPYTFHYTATARM